jgi:hypothetical protein
MGLCRAGGFWTGAVEEDLFLIYMRGVGEAFGAANAEAHYFYCPPQLALTPENYKWILDDELTVATKAAKAHGLAPPGTALKDAPLTSFLLLALERRFPCDKASSDSGK